MVVAMPNKLQPETLPPPEGSEAYARNLLTEQLTRSVEMAAIARILNGIERRRAGLPLCEVMDRDLKDAQRLLGKAKAIIRSMDPDIEEFAIEEMAHVINDGEEGQYRLFEDQPASVQNRMRRWAVTAKNAYWFALEGRGR
jgi:hypothetical protein